MPVWHLTCPDCGHTCRSLVMAGARVPTVWVCSACGSRRVQPRTVSETDPFTGAAGVPACGCG